MKIILSTLSFIFIFSVAQAQIRQISPSLDGGIYGVMPQTKESREIDREKSWVPRTDSSILPYKERMIFREDRIGHRDDLKQHIEIKKETFKENRLQLQDTSTERVSGLLRGMTEKFTNALSRLDEVEARLNIFVVNNEDFDINDSLSKAIELKYIAKDSVEEIIINLEEEVENEDGISKEIIRELISMAQTDIKNAWKAFRDLLLEIKTLKAGQENEE